MTILRNQSSAVALQGRKEDVLEKRGVEIILGNDDLNENEERTEWNTDETVDERTVERSRLNERSSESTDEQILPERVSSGSDHQAIELGRCLVHRDLIVNDLQTQVSV